MRHELFERWPEQYVPYAGHVGERDDIAILFDGGLMAVFELQGQPFELSSPALRQGRAMTLESIIRYVSDDNVGIHAHMVRHETSCTLPDPDRYITRFARDAMAEYRRTKLDGHLYRNTWFLTIIVRPRLAKGRILHRLRPRVPTDLQIDEDARQQLEDCCYVAAATLADYQPRRLSVRYEPSDDPDKPLAFSEIGEALFLIRNAVAVKIPMVFGSLGASVFTAPGTFDVRSGVFELHDFECPRYGAMISYREYPNKTRPGMLNTLLSAPYPVVISQNFWCLLRSQVERSLMIKTIHMSNAGDRAQKLLEGIQQARDDTASLVASQGVHSLSVAVYADNPQDVRRHASDCMKRLTEFGGCNPCREHLALEAIYHQQLPGNTGWRGRHGKISSENFAHKASFDGFPTGEAGWWGDAPLVFRTRAGTPYAYQVHVGEVGNTALIGPVGSGKTLLASFICAAIEPCMGADGLRVLIDKDQANRLFVEASDGRYLPLRRNVDSGLAPLIAYDDTPRNRAYLHGLIRWLIERDGRRGLTPAEDTRLMRGVARQLRLPQEIRSLGNVREYLGYSDNENGAGARLEKWCAGGSMGWLLDNREHRVGLDLTNPSRLFGFDFTELLPREEGMMTDGAVVAAASVIMHEVGAFIDGRRIWVFCDEARFYLDPLEKFLTDLALTGRKKEVALFVAAQQADHFLSTAAGRSIMEQAATKFIYPNAEAPRRDYVRDDASPGASLGLSEQAYRELTTNMLRRDRYGRTVLLWRNQTPAIINPDLSGMDDVIAVLSGRERTIRLLETVKREAGGDTDAALAAFHTRRRALEKAA